MRRSSFVLAAVTLLGALAPAATPATAQGGAQSGPPHAWLYGTWTGGMFPVSGSMSPQTCLSQPVVIFTRDLVMRATLTDQKLDQREIETARAVQGGIEFRFVGTPSRDAGLLGLGAAAQAGFGCDSPDVLHVQRRGENEITFPGCKDFPNPLVRCR